jgi:hypothetical protein
MVSFILPGNSASDAYEVANSLRFNSGSSDALTQTPSSSGNRKTFTISLWTKPSSVSQQQMFLSADNNQFGFENNGVIFFYENNSGTEKPYIRFEPKHRDPSAWYHICLAVDTTQSTDTNRVKLYVNGTQITSYESSPTHPDQNQDLTWNTNVAHAIGRYSGSGGHYDGYMTEYVLIDGTALDPTSFGEFDSDSGIWKPKDVSGLTFGTNGFYLDFENASSLGADVSGNGNNWTVNNLTSIDQTTDTCTNNFCTFTPNFKSDWTLSEGNLKCERTTGTSMIVGTSIMPTTGKWYFEVKIGEAGDSDRSRVGVINYQSILDNSDYTGVINTPSQVLKGVVTSCKVAKHFEATGSGVTEYTASGAFADDDIVQFAMDLDNKAIYIGRNGTFLTQTGSSGGDPTSGSSKTGAISTNTTIMDGSPMTVSTGLSVGSGSDTSTMLFNFGNPPFSISSGNSDANGYGNFEYSVPSGYYSLCTKNLAEYG